MSHIVSVGGVAVGTYKARLESVEQKSGDFGPSLFYSFTVIGTKFDGESIGRFTPLPKAGNAGAEFLQCIVGQPVNVGSDVDLEAFIGREYHVVVEPTKKGSVRVKTCVVVSEG